MKRARTTYCDWTRSPGMACRRPGLRRVGGWLLCEYHAGLVETWSKLSHEERLDLVRDRAMSTFEIDQPWIIYHYGLTHDGWWPLWTSTHVLGRARMILECAVCGAREQISLRIPRFGKVEDQGPHPVRLRFLTDHAHPDRGAPMSWARPLLNPDAYPGGLDLDALAMRLEADINQDDADV